MALRVPNPRYRAAEGSSAVWRLGFSASWAGRKAVFGNPYKSTIPLSRGRAEAGEGKGRGGSVLCALSHQAKTPLAPSGLLLQEEHPDRNALEQSLFQAQQYVDMALQYQRLNDSANDLLLRRCSLERIVKQAAKEVSTLFIYKKVGLVLGDLKKEVLTDSKWLQFVVAQLLTNAVKYTPSGSVSVWCEGEVLYIRDTGIGIRPEDLPRIFEWGYTGCNGHKQSRSTGIGLNLCKRALGMLGHTIVIRSQPGCGTTVEVGLSRRELENE